MSSTGVSLVLGPMLRYVDGTTATVWVETSGPARVGVLGCRAQTFAVEGHHYALVVVTGLEPGADLPYAVELDEAVVWPEPADPRPAPRIRTPTDQGQLKLIVGSCRIDRPHTPPWTLEPGQDPEAVGTDALVALSQALQAGERPLPGLLLLLGDQIYADKRIRPELEERIERIERTELPGAPPPDQARTFEEYTWIYRSSWSQHDVRWLLATVPTAMIFDDHEVRDNWNISAAWRRDVTGSAGWQEQITGAYMAYWLYQHAGNLSPEALRKEGLWPALTDSPDGAARLRDFARHADDEINGRKRSRWSYCRELGRTRLVVLDTRSGRILQTGRRSMLSDDEWETVQQWLRGDCGHLLIASSLPVLLQRSLHDIEAWNEAVSEGAWGTWPARAGEWMRRVGNIEHWAAFQHSFHRLAQTVTDVAAGRRGQAPSTVLILSGDVHHSYIAHLEPATTGTIETGQAPVVQVVSSPLRNEFPGLVRWGFTIADSRPARALGRLLARTVSITPAPADWAVTTGPWFGNFLTSLHLDSDRAHLHLERARRHGDQPALRTVRQQTVVGLQH